MMETQHQAVDEGAKVGPKMQRPAPNGHALPVGRPKGTPNKVTRTIREAVEIAAREVTDSQGTKGLAAWLLERANGSIQDRQIFAGMVQKALPLQVNANVDGGIKIELGWLSARQVGTPAAQIQNQPAQVLDLQQENDGKYRIIDPATGAEEVPATPAALEADAIERPTSDREG